MSDFVLEAQKRDGLKKEASKKYRKNGFIPAVMYGQGTNSNFLINKHAFNKIYPKLTRASVINIKYEDKVYEALIKDYQKDYLIEEFSHLDFYELKKGKDVVVDIPFNLVGSAIGLRNNGVLDVHLNTIQVECKPADIVANFEVDITNLDLNQNIHVKDIKISSKYKLLTSLEEVIVTMTEASK